MKHQKHRIDEPEEFLTADKMTSSAYVQFVNDMHRGYDCQYQSEEDLVNIERDLFHQKLKKYDKCSCEYTKRHYRISSKWKLPSRYIKNQIVSDAEELNTDTSSASSMSSISKQKSSTTNLDQPSMNKAKALSIGLPDFPSANPIAQGKTDSSWTDEFDESSLLTNWIEDMNCFSRSRGCRKVCRRQWSNLCD